LGGVGPHDAREVGGSDRGVEFVGLHQRPQQLGGLEQRRQVLGDVGGAPVEEGVQLIDGIG
jgi:hypothetical protein